ncbi:MAG: hypothetical protein AABW79_02225 [Nanoarchaeota archaeon]
MKTWEKRLIVALIALAFALLIYSYFTDKEVYYSPWYDLNLSPCGVQKEKEQVRCRNTYASNDYELRQCYQAAYEHWLACAGD